MRLRTLHIRNFRHLHDLIIHDLAEINVFAGANNAGKTSLLRAIRNTAGYVFHNAPDGIGPETQPVDLGVALNECPGPRQSWGIDVERRCAVGFSFPDWEKMVNEGSVKENILRVWGPPDALEEMSIRKAKEAVGPIWYGQLDPALLPYAHVTARTYRRDSKEHLIVNVEKLYHSLKEWLKRSFFLWHRRKSAYQDSPQPQSSLDPDAVHIAARLSHLRNEKTRDFHEELETFIGAVIPGLGEPVIRWTGDNRLQIMFGDRSLDELGGGVEHVLAIALVLLGEADNCGLFLEEPESHLHPEAQHRLVEQIQKYRGNRQIFLTSHSPVFINGFPKEANIYHVTRHEGTGPAKVSLCVHRGQQRRVLDDIGVRPSNLLQSNCAVWVEGPTERVLLRHWLSILDSELQEHRHYEFLHSGGSLLAYLGADVDATYSNVDTEKAALSDDLSDIFRVCRHNVVICDRDAEPGVSPSKPSVQRLEQLARQGNLKDHLTLWVTYAYEIEWYFPQYVMAALWGDDVARKIYRQKGKYKGPFYAQLAKTEGRGTRGAGHRKVEYARRAVAASKEAGIQTSEWFKGEVGEHLRTQLDQVCVAIRRANDLRLDV